MRYLLFLVLSLSLTSIQAAVAIGKVWIGPHKVSAISMAPATALHVKEQHEEEWKIWEQNIEGFQHEEGTSYLLLVEYSTEYDAQSKLMDTKYSLVDVLWKQNLDDTTNNELHKTCWTLSSVKEGPAMAKITAIEITMEVNDKEHRISGQSGCNRYFGTATFYDGKFTSSNMGTTKMACDDFKTGMEESFLKLLASCNRYVVKGNKLCLYKDQELLLVFSACKAGKKQKMGNR